MYKSEKLSGCIRTKRHFLTHQIPNSGRSLSESYVAKHPEIRKNEQTCSVQTYDSL